MKFVVAYASLFDNLMKIEFLDATTPCEAMRNVMAENSWTEFNLTEDQDEFSEWAFGCDVLIGVKAVP